MIVILLCAGALFPAVADPIYAPAWGFHFDLPEGYAFTSGDGKERFSFVGPEGLQFDLRVYDGVYQTVEALMEDVSRRLGNQGEAELFEYHAKAAGLLELRFGNFEGWGLCVELGTGESGGAPPLLVALSYGPKGKDQSLYHLSALDSIAPSLAERRYPGPVIEYAFPRGKQKRVALANTNLSALVREHDAEAAQALVDREFALLRKYESAANWQAAWIRYYRAIYRDAWDRLADALFQLERSWNTGAPNTDERALAQKALAWTQGFTYERNLQGSDFVNLVSAATEGRGDCDSRAMLWALILAQADIEAAIMVSREYGHAMGLANIGGVGARFKADGKNWLVAETTAKVDIGRIDQQQSDIQYWLAVIFN